MKIDKNSYGTVAFVYIVSIAIVALVFCLSDKRWLEWPVALVLLWFCAWQTAFHMVPERHGVGSGSIVSAVSDGEVVIIKKTFEPEHLGQDCIQVSVYMDFWDVHANFWPVTGEVSYYKYHPGKHLLAFKPKASEENEHTCVSIRTESGKEVLFKQLAGTFARRVVCYAKVGMDVDAGKQCGIIKFGSRIDYFLPMDSDIRVTLGQTVRACESEIARLG